MSGLTTYLCVAILAEVDIGESNGDMEVVAQLSGPDNALPSVGNSAEAGAVMMTRKERHWPTSSM